MYRGIQLSVEWHRQTMSNIAQDVFVGGSRGSPISELSFIQDLWKQLHEKVKLEYIYVGFHPYTIYARNLTLP